MFAVSLSGFVRRLAYVGHEDAVLAEACGVGAGDLDGVAFGVDAAVEHGGGDRAGRGDEALDLLGAPTAPFEPVGKVVHVLRTASGEGAHEIRNDILLFLGAP